MNNRSIATIFTLLFLIASTDAHAINIRRWFQDAKYPTQQMVEKQSFTNPGAASSNGVISDNAGPTSAAAVTVTSGFTDPDVPRNLSIVPSGTTADVGACTITVSGTDFHGQAITEDFTFIANQTTNEVGAKAFKTITSMAFAASCEDSPYGASWSIGLGESLGLKRCMANSGDFLFSLLNGSKEGTAPTITVDADEVEKNTVDFDGTMNGSSDFILYFFQNYNESCVP